MMHVQDRVRRTRKSVRECERAGKQIYTKVSTEARDTDSYMHNIRDEKKNERTRAFANINSNNKKKNIDKIKVAQEEEEATFLAKRQNT